KMHKTNSIEDTYVQIANLYRKEEHMFTQFKYWTPFISPYDPCPPMRVKSFSTPPNLYITFQPKGLPQFKPMEALHHGTLWPALYSPYPDPKQRGDHDE